MSTWTRALTLALLLLALLPLGARGEIEFRPLEPDPIHSPFLRPQAPRVEIPETRVLPPPTPEARPPALPWTRAVVVQRSLGGLVVRVEERARTLRLSPLAAPLPPDLKAGDRVEIRATPAGVLEALRRAEP